MVILSQNWELTGLLDETFRGEFIVRGAFGYLWRRPDGVLIRLHIGRSFARGWWKRNERWRALALGV